MRNSRESGRVVCASCACLLLLVPALAGCGGKHAERKNDAPGPLNGTSTASVRNVDGSEGAGDDRQTDTGLVLRGEDVGVCVGFESGDVLNSDGEGNANGQFFWDPLDREHEVQDQGLGGISAYDNKVALYFWPSVDRAKQVYADARAKHVRDVERIGNAVVVGLSSLDPSARSVVSDCLTSSG